MPSNPTIQTHQLNLSLDEDSPSNPPELQEEETLEFQEEYPQEVVEEVEEADSLLQYLHHKEPLTWGTSLSVTHSSYLQEIAPSWRPL